MAQPSRLGVIVTIQNLLRFQAVSSIRDECPTPDFGIRCRAVYLC